MKQPHYPQWTVSVSGDWNSNSGKRVFIFSVLLKLFVTHIYKLVRRRMAEYFCLIKSNTSLLKS